MSLARKMIRCSLRTGGKSIEQIREMFKGQGLTYRDFENLQKMYEEFDGAEVVLSLWDWDRRESYHLDSWSAADDEKVMRGVYFAEQTHLFPRYKDNFEKFQCDWKAGKYDFGGASLTFSPEDVEEIEEVIGMEMP